MATVAPLHEERSVSIGRVFQRAFGAITFNPLVVLGLAFVIGAVPSLVMTYLFVQFGMFQPSIAPTAIDFKQLLGAALVSSLVGMVIASLVQAALTRVVVSANEGIHVTFGQSLASALRVVLPLIGLSILFSLGVGFGFILLIVPGIMLLLAWIVAVPALVVEREGIFAAFGRSAALTRNSKWKILGLLLVLGVLYWLLSTVVGLVGLRMYNGATASQGLTFGNLAGSIIVGTIFNMLWGTIQPSLYVELRQWKEGGSLESLADVFA